MLSHLRNNRLLPFWIITVLVIVAALPVLTYPMGRDQGMYANIGNTILQGGKPFIDMWDAKPPPIYYIYAAAIHFFGMTITSIRAIDLVLVPVGMLGLFLLAESLSLRQSGWLAALFYGVFYFNEDFQNLTQSDSLVTVLLIWAAYTAYRSIVSQDERLSWRWSLLSGLLCGLILWFKHYYAFFVLALVINQVYARRRIIWRDAGTFALGGLLTGGSLLLYFWSQGIISEMLIVARGTAAYNAQGYDFVAFLSNMSNYLYFRWLTWHLLMALALLWVPLRLIVRNPSDPTRTALSSVGWRLVVSWWLAALAFALIQAKGFDTHWIPMMPAMALMAADSVERLIIGISHFMRGRSRAVVALVLYASAVIGLLAIVANTTWGRSWRYITGRETQVAYFDRFQANDLKPEQSLLVANYLRERTVPGDSLFIWGFRPEVYFMAQLHPATRYQAHYPLVAWYPLEWQQQNVDILWAAMPPYALVLEDDYMPWLTDSHDDSHTLLQSYTELNNWFIANYDRVDKIGDFIIWKRREA